MNKKNGDWTIYCLLTDLENFFERLYVIPGVSIPGLKRNIKNSKEILEFHRQFCRFHTDTSLQGHHLAVINYTKWIFDHAEEINETVNQFIDAQFLTKKQKKEYKDQFYRILFRNVYDRRKFAWKSDENIIKEFRKGCSSSYFVQQNAWEAELERLNNNCHLLVKPCNVNVLLKVNQIQKFVQKEHGKIFSTVPLNDLLKLNEWLENLIELHKYQEMGIVSITERKKENEQNCI